MLLDAQLTLDSNANLAIAAPGVASQGIIDLMGVGVGSPPPNYFGVQDAVFGEDVGIGDGVSPPVVVCIVGTTFTTSDAATLTVQFQESVDSGAAGTPPYSPNAWVTVLQTGAIAVANLTSGTKIAEFTVPPRAPGQAFPRFIRLFYSIPSTLSFTAGTIAYSGINTGRDDTPSYPAGY
jgi:hypothetical protein